MIFQKAKKEKVRGQGRNCENYEQVEIAADEDKMQGTDVQGREMRQGRWLFLE